MTNGEKNKTVEERERNFLLFCNTNNDNGSCVKCPLHNKAHKRLGCAYAWLDLEAEEEKPMPCPFCGGETRTNSNDDEFYVECFDPSKPFSKSSCGYIGTYKKTRAEAIAAHNRVCKAVDAYNESEVNDD